MLILLSVPVLITSESFSTIDASPTCKPGCFSYSFLKHWGLRVRAKAGVHIRAQALSCKTHWSVQLDTFTVCTGTRTGQKKQPPLVLECIGPDASKLPEQQAAPFRPQSLRGTEDADPVARTSATRLCFCTVPSHGLSVS